MKSFLAFAKKELLHILRDTRTLVILFGMPIAQILIFGYAVTNEFRDAPIAVVDQSGDEFSQEFIRHLTASGHFLLADRAENSNQLEEAFQRGDIKLGIVIPTDFSTGFYKDRRTSIQVIADGSDPNNATTLVNYATQMVQAFSAQRGEAGPGSGEIAVSSRMLYNPLLVSAYNFVPGVVALILLLISAMMTSLTIAKEKETGTMDLLLVSPLHPMTIILGKVTPYALLSMVNAFVVLAIGYMVFEVPILGNPLYLTAQCLLYVLTSLSLGILISTRSATQQAAMMGSLFSLMMPSMLLSGFLFPFDSMPSILQVIGSVIPATYFIEILKGVMLKGLGPTYLWWPTLVLIIMTTVLLIASLANFKVRTK